MLPPNPIGLLSVPPLAVAEDQSGPDSSARNRRNVRTPEFPVLTICRYQSGRCSLSAAKRNSVTIPPSHACPTCVLTQTDLDKSPGQKPKIVVQGMFVKSA